MITRSEISEERKALKRGDRKFALTVLAVTLTFALILYPMVGRAAGVALYRLLQ